MFWYLDSMRNSIPVVLRCFSQFLSVIKNRQFQRSYTSWILFLRYARALTCSCSGSSLLAFAHLSPSYLKIFWEDVIQTVITEYNAFYARSLPEHESTLPVTPNLKKISEKKISTSSDNGGRQAVAATCRPDKKDACWDCLSFVERKELSH